MRLRRKSARYAFLRQLNEHVGKQVRLYRFVRGLSRGDLAQMAGLREDALADIEAGRVRAAPFRLAGLSKALHVPVGIFYEGFSRTR